MRAGEFTIKSAQEFDASSSLSPHDISVDQHSDPSMIRVHLRQDPFRHGVDIYMGRTNTELCPKAAILAYVAIRPSSPGPFFIMKDGSPLTRTQLVVAVRQALNTVGLDTTGYSWHSFRIGAATSAARAGLQDSPIKMLGRWQSSVYHWYIRTPRDCLAAVSWQLASANHCYCYLGNGREVWVYG